MSSDITVHIDENVDHDAREQIQAKVRALVGVESTTSNDERPHLMHVKYDPAQVDSQTILSCVKDQGVHAEMIGL
jgi:hypothetical protein